MRAHVQHAAAVAACLLLLPGIAWGQFGASDTVCVAPAPRDPKGLVAEPLTAVIDSLRLTATAEPWRDFMPGLTYGSPLMVIVTVIAADSATIPLSITVDSAWVVSDGRVWGSDAREEVARLKGSDRISAVMRGGPKMGSQLARRRCRESA